MTGNLVAGTSSWLSPTSRVAIYENHDASFGTIYAQNGVPDSVSVGRVAIQGNAVGSGFNTGVSGSGRSSTDFSYGVRGKADGSNANYAVYGAASGGTTNFAGYFSGLLFATSSSSGVKAFMIDHPQDPEHKVLSHSSVESNERKNVYDGIAKTDAQGFATITMPSWFEALNTYFRYQLTVNGDESAVFVQVKIARKLQNGKFRIRTSVPYTEVNWMVTGNRHDATSIAHPLQVERMKNKDERGKYYDPEAYGKDEEHGMGYSPTQIRPASPARG